MSLSSAKPSKVPSSNGWDNDLDDLLEAETTSQLAKKMAASASDGWGEEEDDTDDAWATKRAPKVAPKTAVSSFNTPVAAASPDDDEWAPLEKQETAEEKRARIEEARRKQQERKEQRQTARAAGSVKQGVD